MSDEQKVNPPIAEHELRQGLVSSPGELLDEQRDSLLTALGLTARELVRWRTEIARLEERERLLRAALDDIEAAMERLHLKPVRSGKPEMVRRNGTTS